MFLALEVLAVLSWKTCRIIAEAEKVTPYHWRSRFAVGVPSATSRMT
jgi:hypothetical protein